MKEKIQTFLLLKIIIQIQALIIKIINPNHHKIHLIIDFFTFITKMITKIVSNNNQI